MTDARLTVFHDDACPLCAAEIALYRRARAADAVAIAAVWGCNGGLAAMHDQVIVGIGE